MAASQVLGFLFAGASTVVALAMLLLVVWQAPRRRENQLMAAYLAVVVLWGGCNVAARFGPILGFDPAPFIYASVTGTGVSGLALFWLVTEFARIGRRGWVRAVRYGGFVFCGVTVPALFAGRVMVDATVTADGLFRYRLTPAGALAFPLGTAFAVAALGCIWVCRRNGTRPLLPGGAVLITGIALPYVFIVLGRGVPPVTIAASAIASVCFTYAILRQNLFDPLARSEARLAALVENTTDPVWSIDGEGRLAAFNTAFAAFLQRLYGVHPARGDHAADILPADARMLWARFYERGLRGERFTVERHYTTPGVPADVELGFNPIVSDGAPVGVAVVARDVSVHKRLLAQEARARGAAEADSQAKSRFLANLSAELRAPLDVILAASASALTGAVTEAARRLRAFIDDVRDLSRIEAGEVELADVSLSLRRQLSAIVQTVTVAAAQRGVRLDVAVAEDVPDAVMGDPQRLRQIVAGVLADAVALRSDGEIVLRVRREAEMYGAVRVSLETEGLAKGVRDRLGFALSARLVEAMGGTVVIEERDDGTSRASFSLRLALAEPSAR